jgi:hypothetical protein
MHSSAPTVPLAKAMLAPCPPFLRSVKSSASFNADLDVQVDIAWPEIYVPQLVEPLDPGKKYKLHMGGNDYRRLSPGLNSFE